MKVLALYPYIHLSSAALLIDGEIVAASPEERFDRQKMSTNFPNISTQSQYQEINFSLLVC